MLARRLSYIEALLIADYPASPSRHQDINLHRLCRLSVLLARCRRRLKVSVLVKARYKSLQPHEQQAHVVEQLHNTTTAKATSLSIDHQS